jgi:hypothetical protein
MKIPKRFGWPAVLAMVVVAALTIVLNLREAGLFGRWRGFPFTWCLWSDFGPHITYYWWALIADVMIALAMVAAIGIAVETASTQGSHEHM